jgi:CBS domain-containing protein
VSRDVVTVSPDATLKEAARELVARRISGMPVIAKVPGVVAVTSELTWAEDDA